MQLRFNIESSTNDLAGVVTIVIEAGQRSVVVFHAQRNSLLEDNICCHK